MPDSPIPPPLLPPFLQPGATIGLIAPASLPADMNRIGQGIRSLEQRGFRVESLRTFERRGYLAGSDEARIAELNTFFRRDDVQALFCVRGGYGVLRLLPRLDYEAARRYPKLLVGYSDITALHLALYKKAGWRGLSGPMVAVEWPEPDDASERLFWQLARGEAPVEIAGPNQERLEPVRPGEREGVMLGGNLSLLADLLGTPYLPDLTGAILFVEDVGEPPYKIDKLFVRLKLAGVLDRLGGLVIGAFTEADPPEGRPSLSLNDVFDDYTRDLPFPVAKGLVYGHFPVKNTLPVGVRARLVVSSSAASLTVLEPVVQPAG